MSDNDDTLDSNPQHRADAPVDGGGETAARVGPSTDETRDESPVSDGARNEAATDGARPHTTTDGDEGESTLGRGIGDLNADTTHPFDQTNGIVEGLEGDSEEADVGDNEISEP